MSFEVGCDAQSAIDLMNALDAPSVLQTASVPAEKQLAPEPSEVMNVKPNQSTETKRVNPKTKAKAKAKACL